MKFSYSRVSCFKSCPYKYKLRYLDGLETLPNYDAANALHLGTVAHTGLEKGVDAAIKQYYAHYPVIDDLQVNEAMKLENVLQRAIPLIPEGEHEVKIDFNYFNLQSSIGTQVKEFGGGGFIGYLDLLVPKGDNHFDLYDFKYSNNVEGYMQSVQLHIYKLFYELTHGGHKIDNMYYVFLPKTMVRQKKTEDLYQFRQRMLEELNKKEVQVIKVNYDPHKVEEYLAAVEEIKAAAEFPKVESRFCDFCEFKEYCKTGDTTMITLPKNERRELGTITKKKIWLYGSPFSGKTTLADKFPDPLMLNTDGNVKNVTAPYLSINDTVTMAGQAVDRTLGWEIFKEVIKELEKKQNDFKSIIVDLLDDLYEQCRAYHYKKFGVEHESDVKGVAKGYDVIRKDFLDTMKRLMNLDYENIILISHEDRSRDITKSNSEAKTSIRPNIPAKVADKLAGMVEIVGRVVASGTRRTLSFKDDEFIFGGGRLVKMQGREIPLDYDTFMQVFAEVNNNSTTPTAAVPTRRSINN